jgi:hypothetical protein
MTPATVATASGDPRGTRSPGAPRYCSPSASCRTGDERAGLLLSEHRTVHANALDTRRRAPDPGRPAQALPEHL